MVKWKLYNGAFMLEGRPPHASNIDVTPKEVQSILATGGGIFVDGQLILTAAMKRSGGMC